MNYSKSSEMTVGLMSAYIAQGANMQEKNQLAIKWYNYKKKLKEAEKAEFLKK